LIYKSIDKAFFKRLAFLALPIIGQDMLNSLVNILDTFMVGTLGETAITAVGLSNQLFFIFIIMIFGVSSGSSILMGQYNGAGDIKSVRKTLGTGVMLSMAIAALFMYFAVAHSEFVLSIYSKDEAVIKEGVKYLRIVAPTYILCAVIVPVNTALKATNTPKLPLFTTAIALVVNAAMNYIFIYVLKMGVEGAAIATVIARAVETVAQLFLVRALKMPIAGRLRGYLPTDLAFVKKGLSLTIPVVVNEFAWAFGVSMYNAAYKFCGTEAQAALQITNTIQNLFWVVGMGIGAASGIILSNELGAGARDKAIRYSRMILITVTIAGVAMGSLLLVFAPFLVGIFNVSDTVIAYSYKIIYVVAVGMIIKLINFTAIVGVLRSGGDTMFCMILDLISVYLVGIPCAFLGAYVLNLPIYWVLAMVHSEEVIKLITSVPRALKNGWAKTLV